MRPLLHTVQFHCPLCTNQHNGTLELDNIVVVDVVPPCPGVFDFYFICPTNDKAGIVSIPLGQADLEFRYATLKVEGGAAGGGTRSVHDDALIEFGKNIIIGSVENIRNFVTMMVPLISGLIAAYFPILEFLSKTATSHTPALQVSIVAVPAYWLLGSLLVFIISAFPVIKRLSTSSKESITRYRNSLIAWRYSTTGIGVIVFLIGVLIMIQTLSNVLTS